MVSSSEPNPSDEIQEKLKKLEGHISALRSQSHGTGRRVRRQSTQTVLGMPLYSVAIGPDLERGEMRGHAVGFFAFGDIATGVFALGGVARGVVAIGGLAIGGISCGGLSLGFLALGGGAIGAVAVGGAAFGGIAIGGFAAGYYAIASSSFGVHVINAMQQDPAAVDLLKAWVPGIEKWFKPGQK